jgi:CDP-glycerol glycerophosphotransferase (TagB/SpsB family)
MSEAPNPKVAKVTANFVYLGATKLFRIEVDIYDKLRTAVNLESSFFAEGAPLAMKSVRK